MAKAPKLSIPGSIFKPNKCNTLYIKFRGKQYSTGLKPDKHGYALAKAMLEKKFLDYHNLRPTIKVVTFKDAWLAFKETLVHKSIKTIANYELAFIKFVKSSDEYLTIDNVERFIISYLKSNSHSNVTINTYLNNFQIFLNYCAEKKWIDKVSFKSKYSLKVNSPIVKSYNPDEVKLIIDYFNDNNTEMSLLLQFMLETGARDVDALTLDWTQIDFKNDVIDWKNKISKLSEPRPASLKAMEILKGLKAINSAKVFSWSYSSATTLNKKLNRAFVALNIEKDGRSLQEFRVTFRMRMKEKGMPEDLIEYMLRHSSGKLIHNHYTDYKALEDKIRAFLND